MAFDTSFVGRTYPATPTYVVGREKIREFAAAIGDTSPASLDVDAAQALGYPDLVAPPTFAILITLDAGGQAMHDPEIGLDYSRVVHGEQRFVHHRPIVAGDQLQVTVVVEGLRSVAGNDMMNLKADVLDERGDVTTTAYSLLVARGTD